MLRTELFGRSRYEHSESRGWEYIDAAQAEDSDDLYALQLEMMGEYQMAFGSGWEFTWVWGK
mgnify:CR=1 FL=1